jgi:hypothetical protein
LRLDTDIWVYALVRRANLGGASAVIARKGDARGGAVLVKLFNSRSREATLLTEATRGDGERVWMRPLPSSDEAEIDKYIERSARIDPDLWVVEIEDPEGRHFLVEPVDAN